MSNSIVILAIVTFLAGLCAIPIVKFVIDRRKRARSLEAIGGGDADHHKYLIQFLDKQLAIGRDAVSEAGHPSSPRLPCGGENEREEGRSGSDHRE